MTTSIEKLLKKQVAARGAQKHIHEIEKQIDLLRQHINRRSGIASGVSALERLDAITRSLKRNVTAEGRRVDARLADLEEPSRLDPEMNP